MCYGAAMFCLRRSSDAPSRVRLRRAGIRTAGWLIALVALTGGPGERMPGGSIGWAAPQDEISRRDFGISGFKPPPRWEVLPSERRSYPQLLAWASRGEGQDRAVITLVGKRLPSGATLKTMIDEALALRDDPRARNVRAQLQLSPGWTPNQRVQLDALLAQTKTQHAQVLRQLIYLNAPFAYVLTLVCPQEQAAARYRDLDDTAANLIPISTAPAKPPAAAAPAPPPPSPAPAGAATPTAPPTAAPTAPAATPPTTTTAAPPGAAKPTPAPTAAPPAPLPSGKTSSGDHVPP